MYGKATTIVYKRQRWSWFLLIGSAFAIAMFFVPMVELPFDQVVSPFDFVVGAFSGGGWTVARAALATLLLLAVGVFLSTSIGLLWSRGARGGR